MIRESDSTLLLGLRGGYGLIRFNIRTKDYDFVDMQRLQRRALGDLLSLCRSRSSGLYCGTSSGLIHLTPGGDIRQFDRRNGIANDMVHGVWRMHTAAFGSVRTRALHSTTPERTSSTTMRRRISM